MSERKRTARETIGLYSDMSNDELAAYLEREARQPTNEGLVGVSSSALLVAVERLSVAPTAQNEGVAREPPVPAAWVHPDTLPDLPRNRLHYGLVKKERDEEGGFTKPLYFSPEASLEPLQRVRHKKRGTEYEIVGTGRMQTSDWEVREESSNPVELPSNIVSVDMREVVIYRSLDDGSVWVRSVEEFNDGRFEILSALEPASDATDETEVWKPGDVLAREAIDAVGRLYDWAANNETEFTGWGDGDIPPGATWWRMKAKQANSSLEEFRGLAAKPAPASDATGGE